MLTFKASLGSCSLSSVVKNLSSQLHTIFVHYPVKNTKEIMDTESKSLYLFSQSFDYTSRERDTFLSKCLFELYCKNI